MRQLFIFFGYGVVQYYPWFNFYFLLFLAHYHTIRYPKTKEKKFKKRIKEDACCYILKWITSFVWDLFFLFVFIHGVLPGPSQSS